MKKDQYVVALRPQPLLFNGFKFKVLKIVLFLSSDVLMSAFLFSSKYKLKWVYVFILPPRFWADA